MKKVICLALALLAVGACKKTTVPKENVISIDVTQKAERIQDAGIIKNYEIIPLDSSGGVLVDKIDKIIMHGDLIYIANYRSSANVLIFDSEGRFVREISRRGRGPLEYIQLKDIFIDETDNTLNLVDGFPAKILKFALDGSGNPRVIPIAKISLVEVAPYPDGYICYTTFSSNNNDKTLLLIDREGEVLDRQIAMKDGWESNSFAGATVFSKFRDKIYFKPIYESPIYLLRNDENFEPAVELDFGPQNWPADLLTADDMIDGKYRNSSLEGEFVGYIHNSQETEDFWLFLYVYRGQMTFTVYDKSTGKSTQYKPDVNTDKYFVSFGHIATITQDHIITYQPAEWVVKSLENKDFNEKYPEQLERLRKKVGDLKPDGNPVLIKYDI